MPRVPIAEEYRTGEGGDRFPKLKLQDKGEKGRFAVIEKPWREFVHYIKCPEFDEQHKPVMETKYRRNGEAYQDYKLAFISQPICIGDEAALRDHGLDEHNCPACEASVKSGGDIPGPTQRFSVNAIRYDLRGGTWDIKKPFSAEIVIWAFNGRVYDEIEGYQREIGDLRKHDLTLECEDPYWQRNKLGFRMEPGYKEAPPGYIKELVGTPGNKATDDQLRDACGRSVPRSRVQEDVDHALKQWRKLREEPGTAPDSPADLSGGIDELLGEETAETGGVAGLTPETAQAAAQADDPFAEFMPGSETAQVPQAAPEKEAESVRVAEEAVATAAARQEQAVTSNASAKDFSFDDLLDGL